MLLCISVCFNVLHVSDGYAVDNYRKLPKSTEKYRKFAENSVIITVYGFKVKFMVFIGLGLGI